MSFLYPHLLWLLLVPLIFVALTIPIWLQRGRNWQKLVSAAHINTLVTRRSPWLTVVPAIMIVLASVCTILALARPINGFREIDAIAGGRNLLIAVDISRSMETQDVKPSRLEEARAAAFELIEALPSDKIGLIVFSGEADLVVPLTYDHTALRDALEQVNRGWAGSGGTNFGLVLKKAMSDFKRSAPEGTNALVILSDGEDTVDSSIKLAEEAKENKVLVITVGIGTPAGGPIPDAKGENGLWQDSEGKHVISKLDTEALTRFSQATGGSFFAMTANANLTEFARNAVQKLDRHEESNSIAKVPNDLFNWFALAALLLVILAILIQTEWKLPRSGAALLISLLMIQHADAAVSQDSLNAYKQGLEHISKDADKAREAFSQALLDEDPHMQAASLYELGNINTTQTFQELKDLYKDPAQPPTPENLQTIVDSLKQDISSYRDAISVYPSLSQAKTNLQRVEKLIRQLEEEIERLKQQQQQNQQNDQQNQQNEQKDNKDNEDQQDKQDKSDEQQNQDQQDDKQDSDNNQDNEDKKKDAQDNQEQQDDSQQQEDQQNQSGANQNQQPQQQEQQQQQQEQEQPQPQEQEEQQAELSDEEKAKQRAASILKMHMDEENGSPIPRSNEAIRPPKKDY